MEKLWTNLLYIVVVEIIDDNSLDVHAKPCISDLVHAELQGDFGNAVAVVHDLDTQDVVLGNLFDQTDVESPVLAKPFFHILAQEHASPPRSLMPECFLDLSAFDHLTNAQKQLKTVYPKRVTCYSVRDDLRDWSDQESQTSDDEFDNEYENDFGEMPPHWICSNSDFYSSNTKMPFNANYGGMITRSMAKNGREKV